MRAALEAGAGSMFFPAALNLFDVFRLRGDAEAAARVLERASLQARQAGWAGTLGVGWLRFAEAESFYASNDLDAAAVAYRDAIDATRFAGSNTVPLLAAMRLAMIAHLRGDRAGALVMANEVAETAHRPNASFVVGMYTPMRTHMWLVLGNLDQAERDLTSLGLAPGDEVGGALEHDYIELARWYVARRRGSSVRSMLGEMRRAAEAGGRTRSAVDIQILQALVRQQEGDLRQAGTLLESALRTAAGFRDRRIFLDAGPGVAPLLQRVRRQRQVAAEVEPLLDALCGDLGAADAAGLGPRASEPEVEPLSRQEVEVLRMLGGGYSNREIGAALFISVNTVKTHLRHIYAKLGARTRTAAISRAAALRLLEL